MTTKRSAVGIFLGAALVLAAALLWRRHVCEDQALMMRTDPDVILTTPGLGDTALRRGKEVFVENCASCHGADANGSPSKAIPDMTDDDYLREVRPDLIRPRYLRSPSQLMPPGIPLP